MKQNDTLGKSQNYESFDNNRFGLSKKGNALLNAGPANIFLPLRLFLGLSFLAAGFDKLFDPQFFDPNSAGYIGNQLAGFAGQSPLGFLLKPASDPAIASIFGAIVLVGELAIGLGTILGLQSRLAALSGFILSIILWLSASWEVTPFFLGSDLPYAMGWLTIFLAGPHPVLSLDAYLRRGAVQNSTFLPQTQPNYSTSKFNSIAKPANSNRPNSGNVKAGPVSIPVSPQSLNSRDDNHAIARRQFVVVAGGIILAGGFTGMAWLKNIHDELETRATASTSLSLPPTASASGQASATGAASNTSAPSNGTTSDNSGTVQTGANNPTGSVQTTRPAQTAASNPAPAPANPTAAPTQAPAISGKVIAKLSDIAVGNALAFTTPDTGEKGYIVHEKDGSVKAFSRTCTHEGCDVSFIQSSQVFACPCHGAEFDARTGAVLRRPARQPLPTFKVQVDANGNVIYTA